MQTSTAGIPSTFNFRKDGRPDLGEIDLIVASIETEKGNLKHFLSTPLWTTDENNTLRKLKTVNPGQEVSIELAADTSFATNISAKSDTFVGDVAQAASYFDVNWGITWKGFNPTSDKNKYGIKWLSDSIQIYAGNTEEPMPLRLTVKRTTNADVFPKGPFP